MPTCRMAEISPEFLAEDAQNVWKNWIRAGILVPEGDRRYTLSPLGEYWHVTLISLVMGMLTQIAAARHNHERVPVEAT
ncbi:MAG: hypothetical protein IJX22_01230 [Opitutales bacterium]|nr:hypothetical protein [Opitutales bacterium]